MKKTLLLLLIIPSIAFAARPQKAVTVANLRVEMRENPVGLDVPAPRFSWRIESTRPDIKQVAYRIVVADSPERLASERNLIWDSGEVASDNTVFVPYEGAPLEARKTYYWKVRSTTGKGKTAWSDVNSWTIGLLTPDNWSAAWIGIDSTLNATDCMDGATRLAARYLRKEFPLREGVKRAMLYISGLGLYEGYINGNKIGGGEVFTPTATDYSKSVHYNVYEVTDKLTGGKNTIGVVLGNGRYFTMRAPQIRNFGFPKMLMQLEVEYADGSKESIVSDQSWKITTNGPIVANNEFDGEQYDATKEMPGWNCNGFDDRQWLGAELVTAPEGKLSAQRNPNIRTMEELKPVSITRTPQGTYLLDMGQNMVGWLTVELNGKRGIPVTMSFAETLKADGSLFKDNLRSATVKDIYIPATDGRFAWEPSFTYHGFRFVEVTGLDYQPTLSDFTGKVNYDQMQTVGTFETSNPLINRIFKNVYWGVRGNYRSMPTDCPQRDERMGWLGDRGMGCIGESFIFDQALLYEKWMQDIEDAQLENGCVPDVAPNYWWIYTDNITWPSAYIAVANMLYEQYGDTEAVRRHYPSMKRWIERMSSPEFMKGYLIERDTYGDWCMPPEREELIHSEDPARKTEGGLLSSSFFYRLLHIMSKLALVSGYEADSPAYLELAAKMKEAYNRKYYNAAENCYSNNTVTANILSLMQGLAPKEDEAGVFKHIVDKTITQSDSHVSTGLIGIQFLMRGLTEHGAGELAYAIAANDTYPSWGYMAKNDATTIWELWNGNTADPGMNSANHVMLVGDLVIWFYENLAGIKTDKQEVGFKKINMAPFFPEGLNHVKASYESIRGPIASEWTKNGNTITWKVAIPANTSADITLPVASASQISEGGKPLKKHKVISSIASHDGKTSFSAGSGHYEFVVSR